jgi:hypothetical protein
MSARLTSFTRPDNCKWKDYTCVAEGSEVVGYSLTKEHWEYVDKIKAAVEYISDITLDNLIKAHSKTLVITKDFYITGIGDPKTAFNTEITRDIIQAIFNRARKVVEGSVPIAKMDVGMLRRSTLIKSLEEEDG